MANVHHQDERNQVVPVGQILVHRCLPSRLLRAARLGVPISGEIYQAPITWGVAAFFHGAASFFDGAASFFDREEVEKLSTARGFAHFRRLAATGQSVEDAGLPGV